MFAFSCSMPSSTCASNSSTDSISTGRRVFRAAWRMMVSHTLKKSRAWPMPPSCSFPVSYIQTNDHNHDARSRQGSHGTRSRKGSHARTSILTIGPSTSSSAASRQHHSKTFASPMLSRTTQTSFSLNLLAETSSSPGSGLS